MFSARLSKKALLLCALCTSFAAMSYEMVLAQVLSFLSDEVVLWESLSIGSFLAATGWGLFLYEKREEKNIFLFFMKTEAFLACLGLLILPLIYGLHIYYRIYLVDYQAHTLLTKPLTWVILSCLLPMLTLGILSGLELRCLFEWAQFDDAGSEHKIHEILILVLYHLGALLASLSFALCIHEKLNTQYLVLLASSLNISWFFFCLSKLKKSNLVFFISLALCFGIYSQVPTLWNYLQEIQIKNFYYNDIRATDLHSGPVPLSSLHQWAKSLPSVERDLSHYQVIDRVKSRENDGEWKLFLDGHYQFSTKTERYYHETLAHVPVMVGGGELKKVLILGGGDGLLARELLKYPLEALDLVELDPDILKLGRSSSLASLNEASLFSSRLHLHNNDAFTWLRRKKESYDGIYLDFPYPFTFDGLRVYSVEFFSLAVKHLTPDGFIVMDIPIFGAGAEDWEDEVGALLSQAGFASMLAFEGAYGETFILAFKRERERNFAYKDVAVPLHVLNKQWFASVERKVDLKSNSSLSVNSVLKPKRISLPDIWK